MLAPPRIADAAGRGDAGACDVARSLQICSSRPHLRHGGMQLEHPWLQEREHTRPGCARGLLLAPDGLPGRRPHERAEEDRPVRHCARQEAAPTTSSASSADRAARQAPANSSANPRTAPASKTDAKTGTDRLTTASNPLRTRTAPDASLSPMAAACPCRHAASLRRVDARRMPATALRPRRPDAARRVTRTTATPHTHCKAPRPRAANRGSSSFTPPIVPRSRPRSAVGQLVIAPAPPRLHIETGSCRTQVLSAACS